MGLVSWWMLLCCWCCDSKDADEAQLDSDERRRKAEGREESRKADEGRRAANRLSKTPKQPRLMHAPVLEPRRSLTEGENV